MNSQKSFNPALVAVAIFVIAAIVFLFTGTQEDLSQIETDFGQGNNGRTNIEAAAPLQQESTPERVEVVRETEKNSFEIDQSFADVIGRSVSGKVVNKEGLPIKGATVSLAQRFNQGALMRGYSENSTRFQTETNEEGIYKFSRLAAGVHMNMWVHHPDYAPKVGIPFASLPEETQTLPTIVLTNGYTISGTVTDRAGNPLEANIELSMQPMDAFRQGSAQEQKEIDLKNGRIVVLEANSSGQFQANNIAEGIWILKASYDGFASEEIRPIMTMGGKDPESQQVKLGQEFIIAGVVKDDEGNLLENALVSVARTNPRPALTGYAKTNEQGQFRIKGLSEGMYGLSAQAEGFTNGRGGQIEAGQEDVEIIMQKKGGVSGRVTAINNQIVQGFQIEVLRTRRGSQQYGLTGQTYSFNTDDGAFEINDLGPGNYVLLVRAKGYSPNYSSGFQVRRDRINGIDIILDKGGNIKGKIVNENGKPIKGAIITTRGTEFNLENLNTLFGSSLGDPNNMPQTKTRTDANGMFSLEDVFPGDLKLHIQHQTHLDLLVPAHIVSDSTTDLGQIQIYAGGTIYGVAKTVQGDIVAGGTVTVTRQNGGFFHKTVTLDAKGRFQVDGLSTGSYDVVATAAANESTFLFPSEADKQTVYIEVGSTKEVNLQVSE